MIVYYDDAELVGGPTALVPREGPSDSAYQWPLIAMPGKKTNKISCNVLLLFKKGCF